MAGDVVKSVLDTATKEEFSQEFLDFMKYITESTDAVAERTSSSRIKLIHNNVRKIKASEKMGVKYMQLWEEKELIRAEGRKEGRAEGRKEGKEEGKKEGVKEGKAEMLVRNVEAIMENFGIDQQKACEGLGITMEEYQSAERSTGN